MSPNLHRIVRVLVELLFDPDTFFSEREIGLSLRAAGVVVCLIALVVTAGVGVIGWTVAEQIDVTHTETVMEPWPEERCEQFSEMNTSTTPEQCAIDEPKTRQVDVGTELWSAFAGRLPLVFGSVLVGWLLTAVVLHALSSFSDASGSFGRTLAITGWGMVPTVFSSVVGLTVAFLVLTRLNYSSDPEVLVSQLQSLSTNGVGVWGTIVTVVSTCWQAYIWRDGLVYARRVDRFFAGEVVTIVAFVLVVATVVG